METGKMKLALSAGALALSMALAGCGGGGSSQQTRMTPPGEEMPEQTPLQVAEAAVEAAEMAVEALETDPDAAKITAAEEAITTARTRVDALDDGEEKTALAETLDGLEADDGTLAMAKMEVEGATAEQVAEANDRAFGLHEALTRSDGANDVLGNDYSVTPVRIAQTRATDANNDIVITRGRSGGFDLMRERTGWLNPATDAASLGGTGWAGKTLTHSGGEQSITVYSNIEAADRVDFSADRLTSIYRAGLTEGGIPHLPTAVTNGVDQPRVILSLPINDMADAYEQGLLDSRYFPKAGPPGSATLTYTYNDDAPTGPRNREETFDGTFHGASGEYNCSTETCSIAVTPPTINAPASYMATGTWTFTPDADVPDGNDAQLIAQDADWLSFGWWIDQPDSPALGGEYLYNAQVFFGGPDQYAFDSIANLLRNNATYTGRAAGLYAIKAHEDSEEMDVPAARGEFTAAASLTARFGIAGTPVSASIGGTINGFTNDEGVDMSEWSLSLQRETVVTIESGVGSGVTGNILSGSATNIAGQWEARLYGPTPANNTNPAQPTGVAGRFFANIDTNTAVAGGFGATNK